MKTEAEARKCWCPFGRSISGTLTTDGRAESELQPAINRISIQPSEIAWPHGCNCIASECMAWRWNEVWPQGEDGDRIITKHGQRVGYCGLAGKP